MQAKAICLMVSQIAKGGTGMVDIAGQWLNLVLEDLKLNKNLKINRFTQMVTIPPATYGPFVLESDYLRTYDMFYPVSTSGAGGAASSEIIFLNMVTIEQFDAEFKSPSISDYPYEFATDLSTQAAATATTMATAANGGVTTTSPGLFYVYPQTNGSIVVTHRYLANQPDITSPATSTAVPWFPYTEYLITAAAAGMMGTNGDDRYDSFKERADKMLRPYLIMEGDEQQTVKQIRLDPRHFRSARGTKPTKTMPF
jgi:hypothetical protein